MNLQHELSGENRGSYSLWYLHQHTEQMCNQITIDESGRVSASVQYTQQGIPVRALGQFYFEIGNNDIDINSIGELIRNFGLVNGKSHVTPVTFGMLKKVFEIRIYGNKVIHLINTLEPMPDNLNSLEIIIYKIMGRIAKHPLRNLIIKANFDKMVIAPGEKLKVFFEFKNLGKFPIEFFNPASFGQDSANDFNMNFWITTKTDTGENFDEYQWSFNLCEQEFLLEKRRALSTEQAIQMLNPGDKMKFWTHFRFPRLQESNYKVELVFITLPAPHGGNENNLITGEYHLDPIELSVVQR
jgi:hypothetical protein